MTARPQIDKMSQEKMAADTPSQLRLSLYLLGPYRATIGGEPVPESRAKKIEALLALLALDGGQPLRRENLVGLLFPDMPDEPARTNLRQSLTRLRRAIRDQEADPPFLMITRESVHFNLASDHFVDVIAFEQLERGCPNHRGQRDGRCGECMSRAQKALDLYRQPFLDGFFLEDSAAFDEWVLSQRERYQEAALSLASQLADHYESRGDYAAAEGIARRQVQIEPWREEAHRQLMRVLAYQGRRGDALRQYERLSQLLAAELGLEPARATEQLRRQIASATDERRNNLPLRDHSFVGRSEELAAIHEHLVDPNRRLVSLVGPGGSGKTALAIETGWQATSMHLGPFIHGVFVVPLAGIERPEDKDDEDGSAYVPLVAAVAEALAFSPTTDAAQALIDYLDDKQLLLILDNAEHLIDSVRELSLALMRGAPTLQILITSRTRLNLVDEWLVEVGGLPVPELSIPEPESHAADDAPQLFIQRAQRLMPKIGSSSGDSPCPRPAIIRICRLVQGLPLGVELAASWVRLLSCQEIAAELEKNLDFLHSSSTSVEARHQSLRAVFEYSWDLLNESNRQIFGRLAVFSGAFDWRAAQSVAGATVQSLANLVDYSLLQRRAPTSGNVQRYEILESLRHFAAEKHMAAEKTADRLSERHSAYYLGFLAARLVELRGERQQAAVREIAQEIGNIRAAWRSAVERSELAGLAGAHESLAMFYYMRSWFEEGESNFALASNALASGPAEPGREVLRARLMAWHGWFCTLRGQVSEGHQVLREATVELRRHQESAALASMLPYLAVATSAAGDNSTAEQLAREALQLGRQRGDSYVQSVASNVLSQILYLQGEYEQAREFGQKSLALQRESGNYWSMAFSLVNLGRAAYAAADYWQASTHYREAIEIRERMGDARGKALGLLYLGDADLAEGNLESAGQAYQESLAIFQDIGSRSGSAEALARLGRIAQQEQERRQARRYFAEALSLARTGQAVRPMLDALWGLAQLLADQAPEEALAAAYVVANHPAAGEEIRRQASEVAAQLAGESGLETPDEVEPQQALEMLDEVAGQLLSAAQVT